MPLPYVTPNQVKSLEKQVEGKQDALESGVNIKTINNQSILGEGNINIQLYKHSVELAFTDPELSQPVSYTAQWLSKYAEPYVENGTLAEMLEYYSELSDPHGIMCPMMITDNALFVMISQILPDTDGVIFTVVAGNLVSPFAAAFLSNTNITDTVTPYI